MKCPECGNLEVITKEHREDGVVYYCPDCDKAYVYDAGRSEQ